MSKIGSSLLRIPEHFTALWYSQWVATLSMAGGWSWMIFNVPSNLSYSLIWWFYDFCCLIWSRLPFEHQKVNVKHIRWAVCITEGHVMTVGPRTTSQLPAIFSLCLDVPGREHPSLIPKPDGEETSQAEKVCCCWDVSRSAPAPGSPTKHQECPYQMCCRAPCLCHARKDWAIHSKLSWLFFPSAFSYAVANLNYHLIW